MLENKLFEALLDVIPFKAYAVDVETYEIVYANKLMRETMYAPRETYCWEKVFGQNAICSWCSINKLQQRDKKQKYEKYSCEFFDETDDRWLKTYDELMNWPDGREVKYSILVDITDQKEIQGDMIQSHAKLAMHSKQLKTTNANLQITKLQLQKTVNELEEQTKKAQSATIYKSQFLANMSHEIRTPMNAVMGMTYLLNQTNLDDKQKDYVQKIDTSSKNLLNIINDILDFSKIEAGKLELEKIDFKLEELLENVRNIVEQKAIEKAIEFTITYNVNDKNVYFGDPLRIGQILVNLLNNAIKFTKKGRVELIISHVSSDRVLFEVKDTGIGLSQEDIDKLFESFTQADTSTTRRFGGTGLGLSISKQLTLLMDGEIHIESELDKGSNFMVELLLPQGDYTKILEKREEKLSFRNKCLELQDSHILLVEDNTINQEIIISLLEDFGVKIDIANNGLEAVQLYLQNQNKYELILMDLKMPIMDGFEATAKIRGLDTKIPIIALTANAMTQDIEATKKAFMNEHLNKPIVVERLYEILNKYISKKIKPEQNIFKDTITPCTIPDFDTLDIQKGLRYCGGKKELYLKILNNFYNEYQELDLETLDSEELKRAIHTLKGLSGNIGASSLNLMLVQYEKDNDSLPLLEIVDELDKVIVELASLKKITCKAETFEKKHIDIEERDSLFFEYIEAINSKKPKVIGKVIEKIKQYDLGEEENVIFQKSSKFALDYNFSKALKILNTHMKW